MKLLVTGHTGQVAQSLVDLACNDIAVVALGRPELDITDRASIDQAIADHGPDIVVSAGAYTAVDKAESNEAAAFAVNRDGAGNVAAAAAAASLPVIHISTDYVFDGEKPDPYVETDPPAPQGVYGASKLAGEAAVLAASPSAIVLRTAWIFSPYGNNFLKTMLRLAVDRDVLRVVADQHGNPTYATDIAGGIIAVARRLVAEPIDQANLEHGAIARGIFHMAAAGETSWAGFAEEILARSKEHEGSFARVEPIGTSDYPTPARRPANSRLDCTRFAETFGHSLPNWHNGLTRCLDLLLR